MNLAQATPDELIGSIPLWVDVIATALGAVSGALVAVRHRFDVNGTLLLAVVCGLGGGLLRDTLIQSGTPVALTSPWLLPTAIIAGFCIFLFSRTLAAMHERLGWIVVTADAVFLGVYAVVSSAKALSAGLPGASCVLVGVLAGVGGGLIRDVLVNERPDLLVPGPLYALSAVAGCAIFVISVRVLHVAGEIGGLSIALVIAVRLLAYFRNWHTSSPADLLADTRLLPPRARARMSELFPIEHDDDGTPP